MNTATGVSPERFAEGLTMQEYIEGMSKNKELFRENYKAFELTPGDEQFFRALPPLNVLVLVEDWCGDAMRYVPVLACIADTVASWNVRVFYRDENPELSDMYLKEGKYRSIPVMVFFDEQMNEVACYVEKPASVYGDERQAREKFAASHSDLSDAAFPLDDMSDSTRALYVTFIKAWRASSSARWQQLFVEEIKAKLAAVLSEEL